MINVDCEAGKAVSSIHGSTAVCTDFVTQAASLAAMEKRLAEMDEAIRNLSRAVVEVAK